MQCELRKEVQYKRHLPVQGDQMSFKVYYEDRIHTQANIYQYVIKIKQKRLRVWLLIVSPSVIQGKEKSQSQGNSTNLTYFKHILTTQCTAHVHMLLTPVLYQICLQRKNILS